MTNKEKFNFGRKPSPFDIQDYKLASFIPKGIYKETGIIEKDWEFIGKALDQENTPHCVGFSGASFGINLPVNTKYRNEDGHRFYYLCKEIDGEPGAENGSYIRSIAKVLKNNLKRIDGYAFAGNIDEIKWWLLNRGPMIAGTIWTEDMLHPDEKNVIHIGGEVVGGHAYLLNEWTKDNFIGIQNSWDDYWGVDGKAYISAQDFETLFKYDGEVMTAVELPIGVSGKQSFWEALLNLIIKFLKGLFK